MNAINAPEQLEAALVESMIAAVAEGQNACEVKRDFEVDDNGNLVINSTLVVRKPANRINIDLKL